MKRNVYDQVRMFYSQDLLWEPIIRQEWVEGFLRQKAWQGLDDDKLKDLWRQIEMFIMYLNYADHADLNEITVIEYSFAIEWLVEHIAGFKATLKRVHHLFNVLIDFYSYLFNKKLINDIDEIKEAAQKIAGGKKLKLIKVDSMVERFRLVEDNVDKLTGLDAEFNHQLGSVIGEAIEGLMLKLGKYFHKEDFAEDFERALYLYIGPFERVPEEGKDEFWLGFWDYFLFDYHLLESDVKPLEYFDMIYGEKLSAEESQVLKELLNSKFTVFYVSKILNPNSVECVNLFTDEIFSLPLLDFDYKSLKKLLFFGHVFPTGLVMINYLTSVEMSTNLRRRIKDEVVRQTEIFRIQKSDATLEDFFNRHALVLRHTVKILVTLSKVNVTSTIHLDRSYPVVEDKRVPNQAVIELLHELVVSHGYSLHDQKLLEKMWYDFSQLTEINVRKPATWAGAIFYAYAEINNTNHVVVKEIAEQLDISTGSIYKNSTQIDHILQLQVFDPRYLSEEGFVISLFES
ncbi:hypothetical protein [Pelosinus sp. sgz500959]|uniref:hypothetical protein n=1 Tax=Pelosinus sp. sgz500959 TaxID=3242472 RepID=UPI00366DC22B